MTKLYAIGSIVGAALIWWIVSTFQQVYDLKQELKEKDASIKELVKLVEDTQSGYERELTLREQLQDKLRMVRNESKTKIDNLNRELNDVRTNGDRLRDALRKAKSTNSTNSITATTAGSNAASDPAGMCADMFDRISIRAEQYAERADELLISNHACIASYNHYQDYISSTQCASIHKNTE